MKFTVAWVITMTALGVVGIRTGQPWIGGFLLFVAGLFIHDLVHNFQDGNRW